MSTYFRTMACPSYTNSGATCYLSVAMQALGAIVTNTRKCVIPRGLDDLISSAGVHEGTKVVKFYNGLIEKAHSGSQKHVGRMGDDYEALLNFLETLRVVKFPDAFEATKGETMSHFTCKQFFSNHVACDPRADPCNGIQLYVAGHKTATVQDLLMAYFGGPRHVPEEITMKCDVCRTNVNALKYTVLRVPLPSIL